MACTICGQRLRQNNTWYVYSESDIVFIFVHGIFSNSNDCWTAPNGVYWPELVHTDIRFENPSIFLGGYYTDFSSGLYRVSNAADELLSYLRVKDVKGNPGPLTKPKLVFIAHSTGGLVVRYLIERNQEQFKDKAVGLVLLASPSRGSEWSNRLQWLREWFGNKMAGQLARDNDFVMDLDSRFADLVTQHKLPKMVGIDAFENKFIVQGFFWNDEYVVSAAASASYFGGSKIIPNSDHFSIAKPTSFSHPSHQFLWDFYETRFRPLSVNEPGRDYSLEENAIWEQKQAWEMLRGNYESMKTYPEPARALLALDVEEAGEKIWKQLNYIPDSKLDADHIILK